MSDILTTINTLKNIDVDNTAKMKVLRIFRDEVSQRLDDMFTEIPRSDARHKVEVTVITMELEIATADLNDADVLIEATELLSTLAGFAVDTTEAFLGYRRLDQHFVNTLCALMSKITLNM